MGKKPFITAAETVLTTCRFETVGHILENICSELGLAGVGRKLERIVFTQPCLTATLWTMACQVPLSMGYSWQPGSSSHGISPARRLEWVAIFSSRGSSQPRDQTHVS